MLFVEMKFNFISILVKKSVISKEKLMKILCIGSATKDIFFPTSEGIISETPQDILSQRKITFELGAKYHVKDRHETLGGCSINVACGLAKLDENAGCYCPIGDDETGEWIRNRMISQQVDTRHLVKMEKISSDLSAIIIDIPSGERTIFSSHNTSENFDVEPDRIDDPDWIFTGDLSGRWEKNLDIIVSIVKEKNIPLVFNPRQKTINDNAGKVVEIAGLSELFFVNKDEAIEIVSSTTDNRQPTTVELNNEEFLIKKLKEIGAKVVALTDGINGAWGYDGKEMLYVPALKQADVVDSTGAGDAFTSGFFAAYLKKRNLSECLQWGIINSSNSVTEYGGQKGLLTQEEIEAKIGKVSVKNIN